MKILSVLAISTACSISLSFLAKVQPAFALPESEPNNSFDTKQFLPSGTTTVDGELSMGDVDFFNFSGLEAGSLFSAEVNSQMLDSLLALLDDSLLDDSGKLQWIINDDQSDNNVLSVLTGTVPTSGHLNFAVSGLRDVNLLGEHFESGAYTLSLSTFTLPQPSTNATLINGGFETGNFAGWTTLGESSIETSAFGSGATQGNFQALLSTGGASFANSTIEQFLGLQTGSLDNLSPVPFPLPPAPALPGQPAGGSAIQQTFTAKAGDILTFDWNFLTNELPPPLGASLPDFSFVSISSPSNSISPELKLLLDTALPVTSQTPFLQETGFHPFSFTIPIDGTYTLGIGVANKFDNFTDSGLLVDNVKLTPVPEPTSVLGVLGFGTFLGVGSVLKRKQRQKAAVVNSNR